MSYLIDEQTKWRIEKTSVVSKFKSEHDKLLSDIAGKGFSSLPGYAFSESNSLELSLKTTLSKINYEILSKSIERELRQLKLSYDLDYKNKLILWEIEKQDLLSAWDQELANIKLGMVTEEEILNKLSAAVDERAIQLISLKTAWEARKQDLITGWELELASIKQGMALEDEVVSRLLIDIEARTIDLINQKIQWESTKQDLISEWEMHVADVKASMIISEETLNRRMIEVNRRSATLMDQKTAIELEAEEYRKQLVTIDASVTAYEVQLIQAKVLTAQKKLELLPILQTINDREYELLSIEQDKMNEYSIYMDAEKVLIEKQGELTPYLNTLSSYIRSYAHDIISTQIPFEEDMMDEHIKVINNELLKASHRFDELQINLEIADLNIELIESKKLLHTTEFTQEQDTLLLVTADTVQLQTDQEAINAEILGNELTVGQVTISNKQSNHLGRNDIRNESGSRRSENEIEHAHTMGNLEKDELTQKAEIDSAANITARLTHLIG